MVTPNQKLLDAHEQRRKNHEIVASSQDVTMRMRALYFAGSNMSISPQNNAGQFVYFFGGVSFNLKAVQKNR